MKPISETKPVRPLSVRVITLSDRAFRGEYADLSGPKIASQVTEFFAGRPWSVTIENRLIPDDANRLREEFLQAEQDGCGLLFTTGGTGIGPRDMTPDVIGPLLDKEIPGIMEYIRIKYAATLPCSLLSRSIAGVKGTMLVYTLPGSVKAVTEYTEEIFRSLEHALHLVQGANTH